MIPAAIQLLTRNIGHFFLCKPHVHAHLFGITNITPMINHTTIGIWCQHDLSHTSNNCLLTYNKANLRDLIAATSLVTLYLKLDSNRRFFSPCDLQIWLITLTNYRAPLLSYSSFVHHIKAIGEFEVGVTVWKCSMRVKISNFFVLCNPKIWWITLKNNKAPLLC